ncbi:MAG: carboxypeptidase-like regulatory domain-containing protein [Cyclobacteriaceae bacterium]
MKKIFSSFFVLMLLLVGLTELFAQEERKVIQFSGVVVEVDSTMGIPGVHVYVPKAGRGASANPYGYFSFPVLEGDSIVFSAVGYRKFSLVVPKTDQEKYTVIIPLEQDTTYLKELMVSPYPTEEMFKEAILAMQLPNRENLQNMDRNLDPALMAEMFRNTGMDGSMNHRYFTQMQAQYLHDAYGPRPNQLLNPFAWAEFFRSLKRGDLKQK